MGESAEHQFLAQAFNGELAAFSRLELYTSTETARRQFDFASTITRDWSRALVGQTLWRHTEGIEKDIRSLLFESEAEIKAYLVRDDAAVAGRVAATLDEFRSSGRVDDQLFRLVRFTVPVFDADKEDERAFVVRCLREQIVDSLLMRVVFGHITARDVHYLMHHDTWRSTTSLQVHRALVLRLLDYLRSPRDHFFIRTAAEHLDTNERQVRTAIDHLRATELIEVAGINCVLTEKGRFFLDLLDRFASEARMGVISSELRYLFERLGIPLHDLADIELNNGESPVAPPAIGILVLMLHLACHDVPKWDLGSGEWWETSVEARDCGREAFLQ